MSYSIIPRPSAPHLTKVVIFSLNVNPTTNSNYIFLFVSCIILNQLPSNTYLLCTLLSCLPLKSEHNKAVNEKTKENQWLLLVTVYLVTGQIHYLLFSSVFCRTYLHIHSQNLQLIFVNITACSEYATAFTWSSSLWGRCSRSLLINESDCWQRGVKEEERHMILIYLFNQELGMAELKVTLTVTTVSSSHVNDWWFADLLASNLFKITQCQQCWLNGLSEYCLH